MPQVDTAPCSAIVAECECSGSSTGPHYGERRGNVPLKSSRRRARPKTCHICGFNGSSKQILLEPNHHDCRTASSSMEVKITPLFGPFRVWSDTPDGVSVDAFSLVPARSTPSAQQRYERAVAASPGSMEYETGPASISRISVRIHSSSLRPGIGLARKSRKCFSPHFLATKRVRYVVAAGHRRLVADQIRKLLTLLS